MRVGARGWALAFLVTATPVGAQDVTAGDMVVRLTGRIHVQFSTTSVAEGELQDPGTSDAVVVPGSQIEIRRARIALALQYRDWITGMIEPDVAMAELEMKRVWLNFALSEAFQVRTGQFKKPFSLIQLTSSLETPVIERSLAIRRLAAAYARADGAGASVLHRFNGTLMLGEEQQILDLLGYSGYDVGMMVHGKLGAFGYEAGAFNGAGADAEDDTNGKAWAARLTWKAGPATPVRVGTAISHTERSSGLTGLAEGTAWGLDLEVGAFRRHGLHLLAEVVGGGNPAADEAFLAAQAMAAWWIPMDGERVDGLELAGRASWGDPDRTVQGDDGTLFTAGVTLYLHAQNRLMLNWDVYIPRGDRFDGRNALRAQAQVAF